MKPLGPVRFLPLACFLLLTFIVVIRPFQSNTGLSQIPIESISGQSLVAQQPTASPNAFLEINPQGLGYDYETGVGRLWLGDPVIIPSATPTVTPTETAIPVPGTPTGLTIQGALIAPATLTFRWNQAVNATGYYVFTGTNTGQPVYTRFSQSTSICSGATCQITASVPYAIGDYQWKVVAYNPQGGYGTYSTTEWFTVSGIPAPTGLNVVGNLTVAPTTPSYRWNEVPSATKYYVYLGTTDGQRLYASNISSSVCNGGICQINPNIPLNTGSYLWKVTAFIGSFGPYSNDYIFTVTNIPSAPNNLVTQGNFTSSSTEVTYGWNTVLGATGYYIHARNSNDEVVFARFYQSTSICTGTICRATSPTPLSTGSYLWKVVAYNGTYGPYSSTILFNVGMPPSPPTGLAVSGNLIAPATLSYRWLPSVSATAYYIYIGTPTERFHAGYYTSSSICSANVCQVTPNIQLLEGTYLWKVTAFNTLGNGLYSYNYNFSITAQDSPLPSNITPQPTVTATLSNTATMPTSAVVTLEATVTEQVIITNTPVPPTITPSMTLTPSQTLAPTETTTITPVPSATYTVIPPTETPLPSPTVPLPISTEEATAVVDPE